MRRTARIPSRSTRYTTVAVGYAPSGIALTVTLLLAALASAQSWQVEFDAGLGSLPSAQGFVSVTTDPAPDDGLSESNYSVVAGALVQGETGGPNADLANTQLYESVPPAYRFDDDVIVVDLRLKIVSSSYANSLAGFGIEVRDDTRARVSVFFGESSIAIQGFSNLPTATHSFDTTAGFVDYQFRIDEFGAALRIDGVERARLDRENFGQAFQGGTVWFGDLSTAHSSSSEIESLRISRFNPPAASVRNYETLTAFSATNSSPTRSLTVDCPSGTRALGGGGEVIGADGAVALSDSYPSGNPVGSSWTVVAREVVATGASWQLRVDGICGEIAGYEIVSTVLASSTDAYQEAALLCPNGKVVVGGGGGVSGASLRQALTRSDFDVPFGVLAFEWDVQARDYGSATSSAAWNLEAHAICSDARTLEPTFEVESDQNSGSPKDISVNCPSGKVPIGGGATILGISGGDAALRMSRPKDSSTPGEPPVGWMARAQVETAPLWSLEVHAICAPIADPTVSKTGLVGRWKGDDAGGDSWDEGHGTTHNGVGYEPSALGGFAFSLDASADQWVELPSHVFLGFGPEFDLYPEASFSVETWFQTDTLQQDAATELVNLYDLGGLNAGGGNWSRWALRLRPEGYGSGFFADLHGQFANSPPAGTADLSDGQPHHLAMVRDLYDRRGRFYVDGVFVGESSVSSMQNDGPLLPGSGAPDPVAIGIWRDGASTDLLRPFHGLIDDIKFYRRALGGEEIQNTAGCRIPIVPRVLNLDAARFASPADDRHGLCVYLEAGDYSLTLVSPAEDPAARFTGWSPSPVSMWGTEYEVSLESGGGMGAGLPISAASPQQAFDATLVKTSMLTVPGDQRVWLFLPEDVALDNRGGVSIHLQEAPEPSVGSLLAAGGAFLSTLARRRARRRRVERS